MNLKLILENLVLKLAAGTKPSYLNIVIFDKLKIGSNVKFVFLFQLSMFLVLIRNLALHSL